MKTVTSGSKFLDIDAYAGCIAYAELLRLQGDDAIAFSSATINESVTRSIRSWEVAFFDKHEIDEEDTFVLIDVSDPEHLDKYVAVDRVEEVIDHHVGFEEFWKARIGEDKVSIEFIGAACTQVYEKWVAANVIKDMSVTSAHLLMAGILDNTLNFKASITTPRDTRAYEELLKIAQLPRDWPAQYFSECQEAILNDIPHALENDTKTMRFSNINAYSIAFGQLVIWNAEDVIKEHRSIVEQTMRDVSENWFINIVSIDEGKSYFLSSNDNVEVWATKVLGAQFQNNLARADRLWLRKEIVKQDQSLTV